MLTVRCPSCQRVLRLPQRVNVRSAQCPLCRTVFDVPEPHPKEDTRSDSASSSISREPKTIETDDQIIAPTGRSRYFVLTEQVTLSPADVDALSNARYWMRAASILGLVHGLICGCTESFASVTGLDVGGNFVVGFFLLGVVFRPVGFSILWWGATALTRRRNLFVVALARWVAIALSMWILLGTFPWLIAATQRIGTIYFPQARELTSFLFILCDGLIAGLGLIAARKTHKILRRPSIRACFR
jgi:hypothetical protein